MAKINKKVKQLDAAVRLVMGGKKETDVLMSTDGYIYSTGMEARAPAGVALNPGLYKGAELLEVYSKLKHVDDVMPQPEQDGDLWKIRIRATEDANKGVLVSWQPCGDATAEEPATFWLVDKLQLKALKAAYTLAQRLDKNQLRLIELQVGLGVMSYYSPTVVAQWRCMDAPMANRDPAVDVLQIEIKDVKRAVLYRGKNLVALGESDGKVNFVYEDGAFLRVSKYDGPSYDDQELAPIFQFDEGAYSWPLGDDTPAQALIDELDRYGARDAVYTDELEYFRGDEESGEPPSKAYEVGAIPLPVGVLYPPIIKELSQFANSICPSGPEAHWLNVRLGFYGENYRAVTTIALDNDAAVERGLKEGGE